MNMNCGTRCGGGHGYVDKCGSLLIYGKENEKAVCKKCKDGLLKKMADYIDMSVLSADECNFIASIIAK